MFPIFLRCLRLMNFIEFSVGVSVTKATLDDLGRPTIQFLLHLKVIWYRRKEIK